jgi:tetrahydromethanopterin S-methyltransferase subunit F
MLQTQIRLLKSVGGDIPIDDREQFVERDQQLVDGVMNDFLAWLAAP